MAQEANMAYVRGFVHGAVVGTVIGLCVAPQTGDKTRAQLRIAQAAVREGAMTTGRALRRASPIASGAVHLVATARRRGETAANGTSSHRGAPV
jgi:gas vesicle protein